jgi:hypothetical protein
MPKKQKVSARPNPAILLSGLRPRLGRLFAEAPADEAGLHAELDRLTAGLKPASFLPILAGTFAATPEEQRAQLDNAVGAWLHLRGLLPELHTLDARQGLDPTARPLAHAWLEAGGLTPMEQEMVDLADLFLEAYFLDEEMQDSPTLFWYADARRRRVRCASFLVDFQPPWDGAVKDLAFFNARDIEDGRSDFFRVWQRSDAQPKPLDAAAITGMLWKALAQNQAAGIRLPADVISARGVVMPMLYALAERHGVPTLSPDEVEAMVTQGRSAESIRREERRFGYQMRLADGSVIRLIRDEDDDI